MPPANITNDLDLVQRSKLQHQLKTNILSTAGYKTDERYDGTRANYRKWIRSVGLNFLDIGFVDAYDDATTEGIEESTEEQWSTFYSVQDRCRKSTAGRPKRFQTAAPLPRGAPRATARGATKVRLQTTKCVDLHAGAPRGSRLASKCQATASQ